MPARPRPARRSSSKPSPSPGFSDGGPNRTTSGRGRPQVRRSAGASPPLRAQAPRAKNLEDRLESRNPVLSGGQASRVTDAILTPGPLGLCRADDDTATRLMQSATAGFACPSIIPERERPLKYRHPPTRSPGWSGLDPAVPDSPGTGQSSRQPIHQVGLRRAKYSAGRMDPSGPSLSCPQPSKLSLHILFQNPRNEIRKVSHGPLDKHKSIDP